MVFDADWIKAMGDNFVPLNKEQEQTDPVAEAQANALLEQAQSEAQPVEQQEPIQEQVPTEEQVVEEKIANEVIKEEIPARTPEEEADEIIKELLGEAEEKATEVKEQQEKVKEEVGKTGDAELIKENETLNLRIEELTTKMAAVNKAYRDVLDQKINLETQNEESMSKLQLISDNPLLQDLLRWMYLKNRGDTNADATLESTLKSLLKETAGIDVDDLVGKARGGSAQWMSPATWWAVIWLNKAYSGLFGEGDVVPLQ